MKLKRLTLFAFVLMSAIAFSISGCKKDKDDTPPKNDDEGIIDKDAPVISLFTTGIPGDLRWTYTNRTEPVGVQLRFGIQVKCPTEIKTVSVTRKATAGPQTGTLIPVWDTTLNETITETTMIKELLADGVVETQVVVFTFKVTATNGKTHEISIEVKPDVSIGLRETQSLFDREENGAYDLVQSISLSKSDQPAKHDIKLAASGNGFKLVSGNGSKFKMYKGTTTFNGFTEMQRLESAWAQSGAELTETIKLEEDSDIYDFVLVKSAQNQSIYVLFIYEIYNDEIVFDYRGAL